MGEHDVEGITPAQQAEPTPEESAEARATRVAQIEVYIRDMLADGTLQSDRVLDHHQAAVEVSEIYGRLVDGLGTCQVWQGVLALALINGALVNSELVSVSFVVDTILRTVGQRLQVQVIEADGEELTDDPEKPMVVH